MNKYLYGASVQGIQDFIFKTNKLQEIDGASKIIKQIDKEIDRLNPDEILVQAAGNIKVIFNDKAKCEKAALEFPKLIMQKAYGVTISQAVVDMGNPEFSTQEKAINELEKKLKTQRNKPSIPLDLSINIIELNPATAKPVTEYRKIKDKQTPVDIATKQKRDSFPQSSKFNDMSDLSNEKNKIAVIHADGNGLGQLIPKLGDKLSAFSIELDMATNEAFRIASGGIEKIRPVILGGDDMTVIINADDALVFTKKFLYHFEEETRKIEELKSIGFEKLTACAGIAYSNEKYPFHYAVSLAEALCSVTKKHAKKLVEGSETPAPSSLMFHNIQSSNFQSWEKFVKDELTIPNDKNTIRCDFGPYYLTQEGQPKIENFLNTVEAYRCEASPISKLRSWLGELAKSHEFAKNWLDRINQMLKENNKWNCKSMENNLENLYHGLSNEVLIIDKDDFKKTPIYDVLQILSVTEAKK